MPRYFVAPAVIVICLVVIWIATAAAAQMPSEGPFTHPLGGSTAAEAAPGSEHNRHTNAQHQVQTCSLPASYPPAILQWCSAIEANAHRTGLPTRLLAALMLQESGGNPLAYSHSGAVGLLQVMPRDGLATAFMCVNGPCFSSRPTIAELEDPDFNLAYGSQMLAELYAKHGSYREALFRYGPMDMGYRYADRVLQIWENYK